MQLKVKKNTIYELFADDENIILPWGIETADSHAFFSLEDGFGYRYQVLEHETVVKDNFFQCSMVVQMPEGKWKLQTEDTIVSDTKIKRLASLTCLEDSYFIDFVLRFQFPKNLFSHAKIAEHTYTHQDTNVYYQYPVNEATLTGEKYGVKIQVKQCRCPEAFRPHMYVRDENGGGWVVHARMIPSISDKQVIKLCNPWAMSRPLPQFLSRCLLSIPGVKKSLWYRGERDPYTNRILRRLNLNAFPLVKVKKGETLVWECEALLSYR